MTSKKRKNKFIIIGSLAESLINFRGELIKNLSSKLTIVAMAEKKNLRVIQKLSESHVEFKSYPIQRNGLNPFIDFKTWLVLRNTFKTIKPNSILAYTIKPIIWGGIASKVVPNIHFFALITGLGFSFQKGGVKRTILTVLVTFLYKISLKNATKVIFQNPDNLNEFVSRRIVPITKCEIVNGSGVDLDKYPFTAIPIKNTIIFLTIGRLLGEKGFREYAQAAQIVKKSHPDVFFQLLGPEDPSPDGIDISEVNKWVRDGAIDYLGYSDNVTPYIKACNVYVLPSYHEGMPRTVLEAMSIGRPILTTDVPGCRETVISGKNGYLVPKADANALAEKMIWFIENSDQYERMGKKSRQLAEEKYDVHKVNSQLMNIMGIN